MKAAPLSNGYLTSLSKQALVDGRVLVQPSPSQNEVDPTAKLALVPATQGHRDRPVFGLGLNLWSGRDTPGMARAEPQLWLSCPQRLNFRMAKPELL
jgi:hypothetical protein